MQKPTDRSDGSVLQQIGQRKALLTSFFFGTAIEWYDFLIYAFLAPLVFDRLFFPKLDPLMGTIAVFSVFAVGFVARPFGGVVFGHFGDKIGRKPVMVFAFLLMGLSTTAIGLIPTYDSIGIVAPLILVTLRFLQGFALGGETAGAPIMAAESAPSDRRGFFASIVQTGTNVGVVLATLAAAAVSTLPQQDLLAWGWRAPFLISIILVGIGLVVRLKVEESPVFESSVKKAGTERVPLLTVLTQHYRQVLTVFFCAAAESSVFYFTAVFGLSYGVQTLQLDRTTLLNGVLIGNCLSLFMFPIFGFVSDKIGRRPIMISGYVLGGLFIIFAYFQLLETKHTLYVIAAVAIPSAFIVTATLATQASFYPELFPDARLRFSGVGLSRQVGTALGGGLMPLAATGLLAANNGNRISVVIYIVAICALAALAATLAPETNKREI